MDGSKPLLAFDEDYLLWAKAQAAAIRARDWDAVDLERVAEEIEDLGASDRRELENRITTILEHLLKLDHGLVREPERQWRGTVLTQQDRLDVLLEKMPSLRPGVEDVLRKTYPRARRNTIRAFAIFEPGTDYEPVLPAECPYTVADVLD